MQKTTAVVFILLFVLIACNSTDKTLSPVADEVCECFNLIEKKLSPDTKKFIKNATLSANYETTVQEDMAKMKPEERDKITTEMMSMEEMEDTTSTINKCLRDIKAKYNLSARADKNEFMTKVMDDLKGRPACDITARVMAVGLKAMEKTKKD